jgi:hypothetical protein
MKYFYFFKQLVLKRLIAIVMEAVGQTVALPLQSMLLPVRTAS